MDDGWLYVVVEAPTGVCYQQQYGGTACRQGKAEGYLVPVFGPDALDAFGELFVTHFRGSGTWNHRWSDGEVTTLRRIVEGVTFWTSDGVDDEPHQLRLDDARIAEADEAWIPVRTPDGPGVLMWSNSD
ncbi:DUF6210 family protein [Actinoallomurus sp. NPDC052308]|uniref:DUF6210 family protein n=1 Tax=Actinoallomurus sp. NPDC052308 TaxID=3155530 RepID=UPI003413DBC9